MKQYRIRLTAHELDLIVTALTARKAGVGAVRAGELTDLAIRLAEPEPGNPRWRFGIDGTPYRPDGHQIT